VKLSCPSCSAKYSIADEKVHDRLAKIRCRKCSATIIIDGKVSPPSIYTSDGSHAPVAEGDAGLAGSSGGVGPGEYSVDFGDNDQRNMTADDIIQAVRAGEMTADMYVWAEGMADWTAIGDVPELAQALNAVAAPAAAPRAAARTGGGRGSAQDLFGGIETAGSEEDVMTSAPGGGAPAAPAPPGARNESSVLFSLSALTASAGPTGKSSVAPPSDSKDGDDSGIIDLKALTSAVSTQVPTNPLSLGTAPLGMAAPLGGITAPAISADSLGGRASSSKTGIYIAAAVVLVGAMIAGAIVFVSGKEPPPVAAAAAMPPPPVVTAAPPPTATETAKPAEPSAEPPATGTAAAAATPTPAKASPARTVAYRPKKSSSSSASLPAAAPSPPPEKSNSSSSSDTASAPKPKKKAKTCDCAPSDLMCAMKCAAG